MKSSKSRLPIMIAASVVLCLVVSALSMAIINSADRSMMEDKINENKASMQQTTANVQKDITAKCDYISSMANAISDSGADFEAVMSRHKKDLRSYADNGGFVSVLIADTEGNAYNLDGESFNISDRSYFKTAVKGNSGVSDRVKTRVPIGADYAIAYYAPITYYNGTVAILIGLTPAEINIDNYIDASQGIQSGMYILDSNGDLVMSSHTEGSSVFYDRVKDSKYANGKSSDYRKLESDEEEQQTESDSPKDGEETPVLQEKATDFYAGDITNAKGVFGWLTNHDNTSRIYFKKNLSQNGWTLFYVRSVELSESTVSFMILNRILLFAIVLIFLLAMIIMLWLQWRSGRKMTKLAYKDEVTGRANWQKFEITCNNRLSSKNWWTTNYAALHININRFTIYNDYYGHKTGDLMLKYIAETLELMCSAKEMCAHRSGDKFVVLWSYTDKQQLEDRINDFFKLLGDAPKSENVSVTVGVYLMTKEDKDIVTAIDLASLAEQTVDYAKSNTIVYFDEKLRAAMTEEHELENLMHIALANDEFKLYMQPKHKVSNGALAGAEALVRWINPEKGFISPGKFIPLFEKNGFVGEVDNYILEQLCKFQQKRIEAGRRVVPISVNVSRVQLSNPNLAQEICALVDKYRVPHRYIDLELTESACFDDTKMLINTINSLREMGFPVSMDDFGSGYSSLNLLKELPFDTLKIDGNFFRNVTDLNRANIVVKNIIDLAKSLDMTIVAEGIETDDQVEFLRTTDCDLIQGYYYSKPISAEEFEIYMTKNKIR